MPSELSFPEATDVTFHIVNDSSMHGLDKLFAFDGYSYTVKRFISLMSMFIFI